MTALTQEQIAEFLNQAQVAQENMKKSGGGPRATKLQDGANRIRVLPHWGTKSPATFEAYRCYAQHFVKSPTRNEQGSNIVGVILCNKATYGESCPVCAEYWGAQNANIPPDAAAMIKEAGATKKYLVNALIRSGADPMKPIVLELPMKVGNSLFGDPKTGSQGMFVQWLQMRGTYPFDLNDGTDIIIRKSGKGLATTYSVEYPPDQSQPVPASVLEHLTNIEDFIASMKHSPADEIKAVQTLQALAQGGTPNAALNMGNFVPAQPKPTPVATPAQVQAATPNPTATTDPATGADVTGDVFTAPPVTRDAAESVDVGEIEDLLAGLG